MYKRQLLACLPVCQPVCGGTALFPVKHHLPLPWLLRGIKTLSNANVLILEICFPTKLSARGWKCFHWTVRRTNLSVLKKMSPECSLEGQILKLRLQYFGHLMRREGSLEKTLMLGKCEGKRRKG